MRLSTWNLKQAVAPKRKMHELWAWMESNINPDVVILTEAKEPEGGIPMGWTALWKPGGIGPKRRWGTIVAAKDAELRTVDSIGAGRSTKSFAMPFPGAVEVVDVVVNGSIWATVVGTYALTIDMDGKSCGHGGHSITQILSALKPLCESNRGDRLIVAGDMNLWPRDVSHRFKRLGLVDLIEDTRDQRDPLPVCANCKDDRIANCGHLWTHKNGNSPNAARQQIDFIFASELMRTELDQIYGGVGDFPEAWDLSDHAPVVADFRSIF
jgi:exonuclease III